MGTILIYGGSGGIGSALARRCVEQGNMVHLVGRNEHVLNALANELNCSFTVGDVTDESIFKKSTAAAGEPLDGLVYSVGTLNLGSLQRLKSDDFLYDFKINCLGAVLAVQAAVKPLKKNGKGSIILFSSVAALQGFPLHSSIGMAKGGINGLTLSLAAELAPKIRVNAIAPSLTRTKLSETILSNEQIADQISSMHALKRLGSPEDIAGLATHLLSDEAGWITGQVFSIDGGRSSLRTSG